MLLHIPRFSHFLSISVIFVRGITLNRLCQMVAPSKADLMRPFMEADTLKFYSTLISSAALSKI
jgi:hypothetical protein